MQLGQATQALGAPTAFSQAGTGVQTAYEEEEDEGSNVVVNVLSIVAFVASLALLALQAMTTVAWEGWAVLFE